MTIILVDKRMCELSKEEQEQIWLLSRTNDVIERDVNGDVWQILDLTNAPAEALDSINLLVKTDSKHKIERKKSKK